MEWYMLVACASDQVTETEKVIKYVMKNCKISVDPLMHPDELY